MSKYYTPEIEEFYVDFEFEIEDHGVWREGDFHELDLYKRFNDYFLRVKFLNKEDIENLGFKKRLPKNNNKHNDYFKIYPSGELGYWTEVDLDFRWGHDDISIRGIRGNEDDYLFRGKIKNKSELKKLLKQLNII